MYCDVPGKWDVSTHGPPQTGYALSVYSLKPLEGYTPIATVVEVIG